MEQAIKLAQELLEYVYKSPTAFHAVDSARKMLRGFGFSELKENEHWDLHAGGKHYVCKNGSALIAFVCGAALPSDKGFRIIGAHTDSPCFRIKPAPEMTAENCYVRLNTEIYGGPILNTWLDRPLAVAGRVALKSGYPLAPEMKLVNIRKPLAVIPNLAIHMNREVNKGMELNAQRDTLPLLSLVDDSLEKGNYLIDAIASELEAAAADILDFDLYLYEYEKGCICGLNNEFVSCGRLDDLAMVHAGLKALVASPVADATNVLAAFDNEEVGSRTKQGGDSQWLANTLERIIIARGGGRQEYLRALAGSFMVSADLAHAVHPNQPDKHDPVNRPQLNKGPVIKVAANQSYTSDSETAAVYEMLCQRAGVPCQRFVNRSDAQGGSTIGPISATHLDIRSVDIGTPILAMHSIRELGGVLDHEYVLRSFEEFYKA